MSIARQSASIGLGSLVKVTELVDTSANRTFTTAWVDGYVTAPVSKEANTDIYITCHVNSFNGGYVIWGGTYYEIMYRFQPTGGSYGGWISQGNSGFCGGMINNGTGARQMDNHFLVTGLGAGNVQFKWRFRSYNSNYAPENVVTRTGYYVSAPASNYAKMFVEEWTRADDFASDPNTYSSVTRERAEKLPSIIRGIDHFQGVQTSGVSSIQTASYGVTNITSGNSVYAKLSSAMYMTGFNNNLDQGFACAVYYRVDGGAWISLGYWPPVFLFERYSMYNNMFTVLLPNVIGDTIEFSLFANQFPDKTCYINYAPAGKFSGSCVVMELEQ